MPGSRLKFVIPFCAAALAGVAVLAHGLASPQSNWLAPAMLHTQDPKEVLLTFDDGPSEYTPQVLDYLKKERIQAVFFLCGEAAERRPDLVRRIRDEGHVIGNHTWSHPYLYLAGREKIAAEIDRTQDALQRITGERPVWFRPPYGVRGFAVPGLLEERGMRMMLWSARGHDGTLDARIIAKGALDEVGPGAIVLLHDGDEGRAAGDRSATVAALPVIVDGIRARGLKPRSL